MEQLSRTLQNSDINAQKARSAAIKAGYFLKRQRSEELFTAFYRDSIKEAEDLTQPPNLPRQRQFPRIEYRLVHPVIVLPRQKSTTANSTSKYWIYSQLSWSGGSNQNSFKILQEIEDVLVGSCNGEKVQFPEEFLKKYETDFKVDRLVVQLTMLPDLLNTANELHQMEIKKVTSINTLCDVMNTCKFAKNMLSEVDRLLRMYLTIPVTSATAERTFSSLRRLKNYLPTMSYYFTHISKERMASISSALQEILPERTVDAKISLATFKSCS